MPPQIKKPRPPSANRPLSSSRQLSTKQLQPQSAARTILHPPSYGQSLSRPPSAKLASLPPIVLAPAIDAAAVAPEKQQLLEAIQLGAPTELFSPITSATKSMPGKRRSGMKIFFF